MGRYVFDGDGELTHCGVTVNWVDCDKKHASCYMTECQICGRRDFDCES